MMSEQDILISKLEENPQRLQLLNHPFFERVERGDITIEQACTVVGQWWHPLHYFPTFLARCIAAVPDIESKSAISRILAQEAGAGDPRQAHEVIYVYTMQGAGLPRRHITESQPFEQTRALVSGYECASADRLAALGYIFATEVTDLTMVSAVGQTVTKATGVSNLEWVDIHVKQEPDHVEHANYTMVQNFGAFDQSMIVHHAEEMWRLWIEFFDRLLQEVTRATRMVAATPA
ncbi:TenA family transcriptional regulator (plasmid) [Rhizobium leguminosarum]